ncbi:putative transcription factor C2H2 family [Helianthus anomalus]
MELIYDLRGHMEQLHQEIMELRKSIKSCVNMQVKMQHSFKQSWVAASATRPVQMKERNTPGLVKHNCSICHVMQVDSLLYRCGHMCTCFKCAVEMQRTSGECSVCEAPIVDVVKAFAHEN